MAEQSETTEKKKKFPMRAAMVVVAVLLMEVGTVAVTFWMHGQPSEVRADGAALDAAAAANQPVELDLIEDRFQNTRSGRSYLYDTKICIVVKQKYAEQIKEKIEDIKAQITTDIATVFRRAEPAQLLEPSLSILTQQVRAVVDNEFGKDDDGKMYVQKVLIQRCMQIPMSL